MKSILKFEKPSFRSSSIIVLFALLCFGTGFIFGAGFDVRRHVTGMIDRDLNVLIWESMDLAKVSALLVQGKSEKAKVASLRNLDEKLSVIQVMATARELNQDECVGARILGDRLRVIQSAYKGLHRNTYIEEVLSALQCAE
ncbi:MAG: hypothetical protein LC637_04365 [Xanthomonadaceae bacterium]|nr:hypothetical protein [Xanthomonadaceae bacterium]